MNTPTINVEAIVREYIDATYHLSLATVHDALPWVSEVHFAYDQQLNLYYRSLASRRHSQEIAANANVAGNIVATYGLGDQVVGLYFEGTAQILSAEAACLTAFQTLQARLGLDETVLEEAKRPDGHQFYKISVNNWYAFGKFGGTAGQKHQLIWNGSQK